ncbi:MAG: NAD-dependent epimerase/dehydratase family protein [Verrucomicrobia bacterium]|nr:NAD-dependent epimerase/dehydratase family protein [Verrucomicrobiota bacterium]
MNCVVTAGPTYEPLDAVRRLTNFSTGKLGSQLADYLVDRGHQVVLLRGRSSVYQRPAKTDDVAEFGTTDELASRLQSLNERSIDAVFHAAAVSDFRFGKIWTRSPEGSLEEVKNRKISSEPSGLLAELVPTTKLIGQLRTWFPTAWLVGWKYEVDGDRSDALIRANAQVLDRQTDACVVNGPAYGEGFGLVTREGKEFHLADSLALFRLLEQQMRSIPRRSEA